MKSKTPNQKSKAIKKPRKRKTTSKTRFIAQLLDQRRPGDILRSCDSCGDNCSD